MKAATRKTIRKASPGNKILDDAFRNFFQAFAKRHKLKPLAIEGLRQRRVEFEFRLDGRRVQGHITELLTIAHEAWGPAFAWNRTSDWLGAYPSPATEVLVSALADIDIESAQVLYLQAEGPYDLDDYQSVPALFLKPLFATTQLDSASSEGALIRRALPHLSQGSLQDRVAALSVVLFSLGDAMSHDRKPSALLTLLKPIAVTLSAETSPPALREGGKLLQLSVDRLGGIFGFVSRRSTRLPKRYVRTWVWNWPGWWSWVT